MTHKHGKQAISVLFHCLWKVYFCCGPCFWPKRWKNKLTTCVRISSSIKSAEEVMYRSRNLRTAGTEMQLLLREERQHGVIDCCKFPVQLEHWLCFLRHALAQKWEKSKSMKGKSHPPCSDVTWSRRCIFFVYSGH